MSSAPTGEAIRVLVDASALPPDRGGVGRYVDELVAALPRPGVEVAVIAQPRDQARFVALVGDHRVHLAPTWTTSRPARLTWEQTGLVALVRRLRPDVLLCPHYTMPMAVIGALRVPTVVTCHDATFFSHPEVHTPVKGRFFRTWIRVSARLADAVVTPSEATREEIIEYAGADPARLHAVPHGVDHERFRPPTAAEVDAARAWAGVPEGTAYLAFLGTLEPRKNLPALVRAFVEVCRDRTDPPVLVLAGGKGWDDALDAAIAAVPPALTVLRPGFIPDDHVRGLLGGATVVTYPSLGEGFGLPVLEAMACGAAVLTTPMLSLPEVGGDAVAYAATPADDDIASCLATLLDDADLRDDLSRRAVARAAGFTWQACADGHVTVLQSVARTADKGARR